MVGSKSKASGGDKQRPMYFPPRPRRRSQDEGGAKAREEDDEGDEDGQEEDDEEDGEDEQRDGEQDDGEDAEDGEVSYAGQTAAPASTASITAAKGAFQEVVLLFQEGRARRGLRPVNIAAGARSPVAAAQAALADQEGDGKVEHAAPLDPADFEALLEDEHLDGSEWSVQAMGEIRARAAAYFNVGVDVGLPIDIAEEIVDAERLAAAALAKAEAGPSEPRGRETAVNPNHMYRQSNLLDASGH
ncbi:unnamed protein product [Tilletia controversa]|nr:hypothetical protein CF335_g8513 [Tilletia laevis]CAD6915972.1 unnamed protein product [Tilletia controversa]CAD6952433.1 unnamed protein product [Tilletia caries]CAD6955436.1 unnamed protein product [Tilletia controversa]CAD6975947.1 unnamed protein product [Tilletia controversa]